MSTVSIEMRCPACGVSQVGHVPESVNVARRPAYRGEVLRREFMRVACGGCGVRVTVERELLYSDLDHGLFVLVFPRVEREHHKRHAAVAREVFRRAVLNEAPRVVADLFGAIEPRVVFGYDELREKVLANDRGLDDRVVEGLKELLLRELEVLRTRRAELILDEVDPGERGSLRFAVVEGQKMSDLPALVVEREAYDDLLRGKRWLEESRWLTGPYVHHSLMPRAW